MIRFVAATLIATTLCSSAALADGVDAHATASQTVGDQMLTPGEGLVPLQINVTQPRRVMVRDTASSGLRYVCTTPCRVYVRPGNVDVTLVGWGAHEYHWDVPAHGGSVHLMARAMPAEVAASLAAASHRHEVAVRAGFAFGIATFSGAGLAFAHSVALIDTVTHETAL